MASNAPGSGSGITQLVSYLRNIFAPSAVVPFQYRNTPTNQSKDGLGQNLIAPAVAQNASQALPHTLGRVPVIVQCLDNLTNPQTRLQVTARSSTSVTIVPLDAALLQGALIRVQ